MARVVRDKRMDSRSARAQLAVSGKPYYRAIDEGLHLGYRKGKRGGKWVARFYVGHQQYRIETIAQADDFSDSDGSEILTFHQAQARAREAFAAFKRRDDDGANQGPYTVSRAMADYLSYLRQNSKSIDDARYRIDGLIEFELGKIQCERLSAKRLREWLVKVAETPPRLRTKKGAQPRYGEFDINNPEQIRQRRASANRTLSILKAGLNHAYREGKIASDSAWRRVAPFREADSARLRYLTGEEAKRLLDASPPDLHRLLNAALFTGARYGELASLKVHDFHLDAGTVFIAASKAGKSRHIVLTVAGQRFFKQVTTCRDGSEPLLQKSNGGSWGKGHQTRPLEAACRAAQIEPSATFHTVRHTYASHCVMAAIPLMIVARNLGHSDTRMVEKHYGHLAPSYVADTIRKLAPDLGQADEWIE